MSVSCSAFATMCRPVKLRSYTNEGSRLRAKIIVVCLNSWFARWQGAAFDAPSPEAFLRARCCFSPPNWAMYLLFPSPWLQHAMNILTYRRGSGDWQFGPNYLASMRCAGRPRMRCPTTTLGAGRRARSSGAKTPAQRRTGLDGQRLLEKVGGDRWRRPRARNGCRAKAEEQPEADSESAPSVVPTPILVEVSILVAAESSE
jgi:hypothetical protein